jgi:2-isopropylmalate synthase
MMQPRKTSELKYHNDKSPGQRYLAIDNTLLAISSLYCAVRRVNTVPTDQPEYVESHVHSVDSLYLFIGEGMGLTGLKAIIRIGNETREIESPMSVFVPKGTRHSYKLIAGSGTYINIVLDGNYNECTSGAESEKL